VGRCGQLSGQVRAGTVQDVMPAPSPVVAVGHVVHLAVRSDEGGLPILTGAPGQFLPGELLHVGRRRLAEGESRRSGPSPSPIGSLLEELGDEG